MILIEKYANGKPITVLDRMKQIAGPSKTFDYRRPNQGIQPEDVKNATNRMHKSNQQRLVKAKQYAKSVGKNPDNVDFKKGSNTIAYTPGIIESIFDEGIGNNDLEQAEYADEVKRAIEKDHPSSYRQYIENHPNLKTAAGAVGAVAGLMSPTGGGKVGALAKVANAGMGYLSGQSMVENPDNISEAMSPFAKIGNNIKGIKEYIKNGESIIQKPKAMFSRAVDNTRSLFNRGINSVKNRFGRNAEVEETNGYLGKVRRTPAPDVEGYKVAPKEVNAKKARTDYSDVVKERMNPELDKTMKGIRYGMYGAAGLTGILGTVDFLHNQSINNQMTPVLSTPGSPGTVLPGITVTARRPQVAPQQGNNPTTQPNNSANPKQEVPSNTRVSQVTSTNNEARNQQVSTNNKVVNQQVSTNNRLRNKRFTATTNRSIPSGNIIHHSPILENNQDYRNYINNLTDEDAKYVNSILRSQGKRQLNLNQIRQLATDNIAGTIHDIIGNRFMNRTSENPTLNYSSGIPDNLTINL